MINKDGGTIFRFCGGHNCYEEGLKAHGGSPSTRENPGHVTITNIISNKTYRSIEYKKIKTIRMKVMSRSKLKFFIDTFCL